MNDWPAIVRQCGSLVWRTAYRLLANEADASDCYQDTFVSAVEVAGRAPVDNWPGLMQRLATARALDILRQRILQGREHAGGDPDQTLSEDTGPLQQAQETELMERLLAAIARLPSQQGETFCLRYLSQCSYEQIAAEMRMTVDAVGVNLHRARSRLRELLPWANSERRIVR